MDYVHKGYAATIIVARVSIVALQNIFSRGGVSGPPPRVSVGTAAGSPGRLARGAIPRPVTGQSALEAG